MAELRIALRADASAQIGIGHVARCLALAQALRAAHVQVCLVSRALGVDTAEMARAAGIAHRNLETPSTTFTGEDETVPHAGWAQVPWQLDAEQTVTALRDWVPEWVVVDHYAFDARWHRALREALSSSIAVIDDLADRELDGSLLIDHNYADDHRAKYGSRWPTGSPLLGGPRYALLAPQYASTPRYSWRKDVASIGIFMGGTDVSNLSARVHEACRAHAGFVGPIEVVTTRANPNLDTLRYTCTRWPATDLSLDVPDLCDFFARHDLQIGAGGGAIWERCCIGVPTLALVTADNQRAVVPPLAAMGILATPDSTTAPTVPEIGRAIKALLEDPPKRRAMSERSRLLVDGLGARRVALQFAASMLRVRRANLDDARMMYCWRNHSDIRSVSRDPAEIAWPDHLAWLRGVLSNPTRTLLIGVVGEIPVGVIRFDRLDNGPVEVSLYLDPSLHGLGLGTALLAAGEAFIGDDTPFVATVLEGNTSSQRMFASSGYRSCGEGQWIKDAPPRQRENTTS